MSIFGVFATVPLLWTMTFPQTVTLDSVENAKTKIKIKEEIMMESEEILKNLPIAKELPEKSERDKQLEKWESRQADKWDNLPEGKFTVNASAYTAAADECGKADGITASGVKVQENRTLACPPNFPFGVKIQIEGMGIYVCEDRGGAIKGNHMDIYMQTKSQAFAFGRRSLEAQIIR